MGLNQKEIHMEQKSKYEIEIENFRKIFDDKKNMRIAIYGIGRRTATQLPGITDYNITGLLDRDKNNVGKELCDIKVIPIDNIEEKADLIIINSDPSNYEIIFKRISGKVTIPVYYADGRLACLSDKDKSYEQNEYWKSSYEELKDKIDLEDMIHTSGNDDISNSVQSDAVDALVALGYSKGDAFSAVKKIEITESMDVEEVLKKALKNII